MKNEDLEAWEQEAQSYKKIEKHNRVALSKDKEEMTKELLRGVKQKERNELQTRSSETRSSDLQNRFSNIHKDFTLKKGMSLGLDRKTDKKLKAGEYPIDLRVDLHGLTLDEAFWRLRDKIEFAFESGLRLVLVITGKGLHSTKGEETIKSSVGEWLSLPEFSSKIIKYVDANKRHGGSGAVYVLLKKLTIDN